MVNKIIKELIVVGFRSSLQIQLKEKLDILKSLTLNCLSQEITKKIIIEITIKVSYITS